MVNYRRGSDGEWWWVSLALDPSYGYDTNTGNLISVTYPDGKSKQYLYEKSSTDMALAYALTGIIDENGKRFATFDYVRYHYGQDTIYRSFDPNDRKCSINPRLLVIH